MAGRAGCASRQPHSVQTRLPDVLYINATYERFPLSRFSKSSHLASANETHTVIIVMVGFLTRPMLPI